MCGIIAIAGKEAPKLNRSNIGAMLSCLSKRGPDDKGFEIFSEAILGQTRLAIVDLSPAGHQPMRDNTHPYSIVFNGEIYGYKDLRDRLEKKGHAFSSQSDTEVILKSYAEYGRDCVKHLDGMFAFAIWDEAKRELFIARDRFGKKPLYYAWHEGTFICASEIKSIFASGLVKGEIDPEALDDYLRLMYVPSHRSIYSNIFMLPPAHAGVVEGGKIETWRYWRLEKMPITDSYDEAKRKIQELFDEAVKKRMVADVEVGALLSGGVDSTLVALYAQKHASFPLKTFSVDYQGAKSELSYALEASKKIGTDHQALDITSDLAGELEKIIAYMDEPHADSSNFPQSMISELASKKVKVALTGDGADELFMGYGWYQKKWHLSKLSPARWFLSAFSIYKHTTSVFDRHERKKLLRGKLSGNNAFERSVIRGIRGSIERINAFDLNVYLPGQLLSKIDRTSMMHSIEVRSPFLDTALAQYVYSLPTKWKLSKTENKIILKDILAEVFSEEFVYRRKQGFGAPIDSWLQQKEVISILDRIFDEANPAFRYININAAKKIRNSFSPSDRKSAERLWTLACLLLWFEKHHA